MKLEGVRAQGAGGKLLLNCFARYQLRGSNLVCILKLTELDALEVPEKFMVVVGGGWVLKPTFGSAPKSWTIIEYACSSNTFLCL